MGVMQDSNKAVSIDFKTAGSLIYIIGTTYNELGGSEYYKSLGFIGNSVPRVNPGKAKELMDNLSLATARGLLKACHDISDGGIGVAIAEMAFAGWLGATIRLNEVPLGEPVNRDDLILFSESNSRFLAEVAAENKQEFEKAMGKSAFSRIGEVTSPEMLEIYGLKGDKALSVSIKKLKEAWQKPLDW
jgi:phosphoribosylformylglycinamidine synthase